MAKQDLSPASPSLSPSLSLSYSSLNPELQRLFIKVFRYLWGVVHARRFNDRGGVLASYWCIDRLRVQHGLNCSELALLSYLYQMSDKGSKVLRSADIVNSPVLSHTLPISKDRILNTLKRAGYLTRATKDLSHPFLASSYSIQPVFISLTSQGVRLIEGIEKDLYKLLLNTSLDDLTGRNKKTG